ncbi:MAG: hypothetical protein IJD84_09710 [Parabacteroides sp.]|nr:hypothetical protein [Parabacteroides sp.]MBR2496745.1 hypothetical protein [Parabacteroides sp.]
MTRGSKIDMILTWLFMVLAIVAVVFYFVFPENRLPFLYCGGAAICFRLVQYLMRFIS